MTKHDKALLDLISYTEGTIGVSQNGYDITVGYFRIIGWTPTTTIGHGLGDWYNKELNSTAGGRYQFTKDTWLGLNNNTNAPFTKVNQDNSAIKLVNRKSSVPTNQLEDKIKFTKLISDLKGTWVSFKKFSIDELHKIYKTALALY
jgi:muramidase (phage lysozyme)